MYFAGRNTECTDQLQSGRKPELARERQAQVIEKMKKAGYLKEEEDTD